MRLLLPPHRLLYGANDLKKGEENEKRRASVFVLGKPFGV